MEIIGLILLLVAVGILVLPIVAIATASSNKRELREEMADLRYKIRDLELQVNRLAASREVPVVVPAPVKAAEEASPQQPVQAVTREETVALEASLAQPPEIAAFRAPAEAPKEMATAPNEAAMVESVAPLPPTDLPFEQAPVLPPQPAVIPAEEPVRRWELPLVLNAAEEVMTETPAERSFSLEQRLGTNWLNKLGVAILVVGLAFFLAFKLETMGPAGKVLCGYAVSLALLAGGVWLERKETYRIFARAGIGGGWALGFFTTFAMHHVNATKVMPSLIADLVLMLLVAAGMVAHSLRYRSQTVTALAFLLGFLTLLTSHMEAANGTAVFSLTASAVLALGLVVVTRIRHWAVLEVAGIVAVYLTHWVWLGQVLPQNHAAFTEFWPSTCLIVLYWLIFRAAYVWRTPLDQKEENLSSLSAVLNSGGVLGLLKYQSAHPEWAFWALAALGSIEMVLAFVVRARRRQAFVVLSTIATVLLVSAVPFKFHGVSWPVLWLVEAQVLAICGLRLEEPVFRRLGLLAGVITGCVLALHDVAPLVLFRLDYPDPVRHTSLTVALALAAILYWVHSEVYPRRWPQIAANDLELLALSVTSWLGAAAAATALWVALPDQWLPTGWLLLALLLAYVANKFRAMKPELEADALIALAAAALAFDHIRPLAFFRLDQPDPSHHISETIVLALSAVAFWIRAEIYPRLLSAADAPENQELESWRRLALPVTSALGLAAAASALWVGLPAQWVVAGWLALVILLGLVADLTKSIRQAEQADILGVVSVVALIPWNLLRTSTGWWNYDAPLFAAVALLYLGMRRKTVPSGARGYVAPAYSWAATLLLAFAAADTSSASAMVAIWIGLALALSEIGRFTSKGFLRWQGYFLAALAFGRYFIVSLPAAIHGPVVPIELTESGNLAASAVSFSLLHSALLEVLILLAVGYWLLGRTRSEICTEPERMFAVCTNVLGTVSLAVWFAYLFPSSWVPVQGGAAWVTAIWAGMAVLFMVLARVTKRRAFLVQAEALVIAVMVRTFFVDLPTDASAGFWHGTLFRISIASMILLAALPAAFKLRGAAFPASSTSVLPEDLVLILKYPEQWFFFAAFALEVISLAVKLTSGHITTAWSLLGLGVFLFAIAVGERSFRLAGLGLLLVSVVKILLLDVWALSPSDRYTTLIVLGLALLAVSFLYTRFSTVIRRYL